MKRILYKVHIGSKIKLLSKVWVGCFYMAPTSKNVI